jgi:hypothetical protein
MQWKLKMMEEQQRTLFALLFGAHSDELHTALWGRKAERVK